MEKILLYFACLLAFTWISPGDGYWCPRYCNATRHLQEMKDCGEMGWCCGPSYALTCCVHYWEEHSDLKNATQEECNNMEAIVGGDTAEGGDGASGITPSTRFLLITLGILSAWIRSA